jgi:hypothetical protein
MDSRHILEYQPIDPAQNSSQRCEEERIQTLDKMKDISLTNGWREEEFPQFETDKCLFIGIQLIENVGGGTSRNSGDENRISC